MRRSGFRAGYHPSPAVLNELKVFDKRKRNYIDKRGNVYSNRAVQEARNGYITLEEAKRLRQEGWSNIIGWKARNEFPLSIPTIAKRWEARNDMPSGTAFKSKKFRNEMKELIRRVTRTNQDDDEYYESVDGYLDDHFDMSYEEIGWYY